MTCPRDHLSSIPASHKEEKQSLVWKNHHKPTNTQRNGHRKMESAARVSLEHSQTPLMPRTHQMSENKADTLRQKIIFFSRFSLSAFMMHTNWILKIRNTIKLSSSFLRNQNSEKVSHLFVPLLSPPQAGPVVISETQKVVVGHQALNWVTHYINVDGLCPHTKSAAQNTQNKCVISYRYKNSLFSS